MISIDRAGQNFPVPSGKDHFLYNSLYNRDVEFMKNLIRTNSSGSELDRNPNLQMHYNDFDPRSVHDHQSSQSTCPPGMEHQQHLFGPHMLPRSFSCSQPSGGAGLMDYQSETIKHHCKSEKHDEEGGGKCQMHSNSGGGTDGGGILVKTEFNEMQQSKSSPVHEAYEMTSNAFTSTILGSGSNTGQFHHDHHDSGSSPPLPESSTSNTSHHHLQHHHHQCSPHSYESYLYASSSAGGRAAMSPRHPPGTMATTSGGGSEVSGTLFHCKSFFADSGSGSTGIAAFYPNNHHHANGESCRDDSGGFPNTRDSDDKIAIGIKARKIPE